MRIAITALVLLAAPASAGQPTARPTDEVRGEALYRRHCVACHGVRNAGDGPVSAALVASVPDLTGVVKSDDSTSKVVLKGRDAMPGYEATFDRQDAIRVLKYMAALGPDKELPAMPTKGTRKKPTKKQKK